MYLENEHGKLNGYYFRSDRRNEDNEMKCKFCNAELEEGAVKCPACGAEVEQTAKLSAGKIALLVVLALTAVAVVIALIMGGSKNLTPEHTSGDPMTATGEPSGSVESQEPTTPPTVPADGNPDDVTCKGTYTVSDEDLAAAADKVVSTVGEQELTNADLQVYYWMQFYDFMNNYSGYLNVFGLNLDQSLDTQMSIDGSTTWQQYFLQTGLNSWHSYAALSTKATEAGYQMPAEYRDYLDSVPSTMNAQALEAGYENATQMLQADMGPGATMESYMKFMEAYYLGYLYYNDQVEQIDLSRDEVAAYFAEHAEEYAAKNLTKDTRFVDVRHILVMPQGGATGENGTTVYSEAEWETCRQEAQKILDEYLAGEQTEERFAELAGLYSVDGGSNQNGGLYTDVYVGQMVEPFENWCFDASRTHGQTGLVKTTYGYHVMFFVQSKEAWYETAWSDLLADRADQLVQDAMNEMPMTVDYSAIVLGDVAFDSAY